MLVQAVFAVVTVHSLNFEIDVATYLHPGKRLGSRYQLESMVGTGQFGQVWRAKKLHPPSDMPVALKLPLDPLRREAVLMADGQHMIDLPSHAGIVAIHWQGRVGSLWVVEMEFVMALSRTSWKMRRCGQRSHS